MNCSAQPIIIESKNPQFILSTFPVLQFVNGREVVYKLNQFYSMEGNMGETAFDYLKKLMSCQANSKMESKDE